MNIALIASRLNSSRFPGKALADVCGEPMIRRVVRRVAMTPGIDEVRVVVPPGDAVEYVSALDGVQVAVYSTQRTLMASGAYDVTSAFVLAVDDCSGMDVAVRVTGDCPLYCPEVGDLVVHHATHGSALLVTSDTTCSGFPDGLDVEAFPVGYLRTVIVRSALDREHVTRAMRRGGSVYTVPHEREWGHWPPLSVNTPEDLSRVRQWAQIIGESTDLAAYARAAHELGVDR